MVKEDFINMFESLNEDLAANGYPKVKNIPLFVKCLETMAVLMASGHAINIPTSPFDSARALTATIAAELGDTARGSDHYKALFSLGILLFLVTFVINLLADVLVRKGASDRS